MKKVKPDFPLEESFINDLSLSLMKDSSLGTDENTSASRRTNLRLEILEKAGKYEDAQSLFYWLTARKEALLEMRKNLNRSLHQLQQNNANKPISAEQRKLTFDLLDVQGRLKELDLLLNEGGESEFVG